MGTTLFYCLQAVSWPLSFGFHEGGGLACLLDNLHDLVYACARNFREGGGLWSPVAMIPTF